MNKLYKISILVLIFVSASLKAQTLKNIYRHHQPVLHIPTQLIDKVETVEINGERVLKVIQLNGFVSQIPLSQIDSITHSEGQAIDPAQLGNLRTASVMGVVTGPTGAPEKNAIVRSPYNGEETHTDPNGVFFLNNILVYDKLGYITITKPGFHQGSRSFLPLENGSNRVNVQLLSLSQSGSFSAASGGTVTSGLLQISFPANGVTLNGQPYIGIVKVYSQALDPTAASTLDQMPGELLGGMNDSLRLLRSFGMASIELRDDNMNELQLAPNVSATLTFTIPTTLLAEAPETIDWWSFDEELGFWMHEGEAVKQDSQYVGMASHFSWWNCDVPENFNDFHGTLNSLNGSPISDALVSVVTDSIGTGSGYTNTNGEFSGRVPKNQNLTLNIYFYCSTLNNWTLAHMEEFESLTAPIEIEVITNPNGNYPITGTLVNCEGQPIESGYIKMGPHIFLTNQGGFTIPTCNTGIYSFRGYDISNLDSIKTTSFDTVTVVSQITNIGNLQACNQTFGEVGDIDGNVYPTVLIGEQWWMAENLKTNTYTNGELIPNVMGVNEWVQLSTGAWCNYDNNVINDSIYGKLYNWYTTVDPRGLCPTNWHVPTEAEWTVLIDYLGGLDLAGGKMRSLDFWYAPNTGATNESDFSGLPGSYRADYDGSFQNIGFNCVWWSSTDNTTTGAANYNLHNYDGFAYYYPTSNKRSGFSVRCIKD